MGATRCFGEEAGGLPGVPGLEGGREAAWLGGGEEGLADGWLSGPDAGASVSAGLVLWQIETLPGHH